MSKSYEFVKNLMEIYKNQGSLCLDVTYKDNNIYMNTIKYNTFIGDTSDVIMNENMKILKDVPDILFLMNSTINNSISINTDTRISNGCLWFNVIKALNIERNYDVSYDDIKNYKDVINFNGHTYKISSCMVFDKVHHKFKMIVFEKDVNYMYTGTIETKEELLKIFKGEYKSKFIPVSGKLEPSHVDNYVPIYMLTSNKTQPLTFGTPAATPFTFGTPTQPTKPLTFGTPTAPPTTFGSFTQPTKPLTFGTPTAPPTTFGSFTQPTKPLTFGTPAATPFTFGTPTQPAKLTTKKKVSKPKKTKREIKRHIKKVKITKIKIIKKK